MRNSKNDPFAAAIEKDDDEAVARLLAAGRTVGEQFHFHQTPLHLAANSGAKKCALLFIKQGADVESHDEAGHTPLLYALQSGHEVVVDFLLTAGARLHYVFKPADTPEIRERLREQYRWIAGESRKAHPEIYRLIDEGSSDFDRDALNLELAENFVQTAISTKEIYAVHECGTLGTLRLVASQPGVSLNIHDGAGYWPLKTFAENGNAEALAWLLADGAEPDFTSTGDTALHATVAGNHLECARLLLLAGANPNQQDVDGCVPMICVKSDEMLDLLLAHGADLNIGDQCGNKPSHWAEMPKLKKRLLALEKQSKTRAASVSARKSKRVRGGRLSLNRKRL